MKNNNIKSNTIKYKKKKNSKIRMNKFIITTIKISKSTPRITRKKKVSLKRQGTVPFEPQRRLDT